MSKLCRDCGAPIMGRADKKFCDDGCRSAYHNQINADKLKDVHYINSVLKKNLDILNQLNPRSKTTIPASMLYEAGLNLYFYTHIYTLPNGKVYRFCYNQGYTQLSEQRFQLIKKEMIDQGRRKKRETL